jgi:hypothetical protein
MIFVTVFPGVPTEFGGGRTASDIVAWIRKKAGPPSNLVSTNEALKGLIAVSFIFVFLSFEVPRTFFRLQRFSDLGFSVQRRALRPLHS